MNVLHAHAKFANRTKPKILIFRIGNLGDTIISLPALWAVRKAFPQSNITLLGNVNGQHVSALSVLPKSGLFDDWLTYPTGDTEIATKPSLGLARLFLRLRRERFDLLVYLAPRARTARQVRRDKLFFRAAGIKNFIGDTGFIPIPPKVESEPLPVVEHEADHLLARLRLGGIDVPAPNAGEMDLKLTESEIEKSRQWLIAHCGPAFFEKRIVGIGVGSKWQSKIWMEERFAELGARLIGALNLFPVIFGGPEDHERGERLLQIWGRGANAAGALNIRESAAALKFCRLYVGNDTGTMHLAAAVKTLCVGIFSSLDWRGRWYPYGTEHQVLREFVSCEGCLLFNCPNDNLCLRKITVDDVFDACQKILQESKKTILVTE